MTGNLTDLNTHLFAQLERLSKGDLTPEQIEVESERAKAVVGVSQKIIENATLQFKAASLVAEHGAKISGMMPESFGQINTIEHKPVEQKTAKRTLTAEEAEQEAAKIIRENREQREIAAEASRQRREAEKQ